MIRLISILNLANVLTDKELDKLDHGRVLSL